MTMRAMVLREHGGPEVLHFEDVAIPEPGPGEVRVRVRAVSVNHLDIWVRRGLPNLKLEYPHRLGADIVGEVEPLRQLLGGTRSILYFSARGDAGLTRAFIVLAAELVFWLAVGEVCPKTKQRRTNGSRLRSSRAAKLLRRYFVPI